MQDIERSAKSPPAVAQMMVDLATPKRIHRVGPLKNLRKTVDVGVLDPVKGCPSFADALADARLVVRHDAHPFDHGTGALEQQTRHLSDRPIGADAEGVHLHAVSAAKFRM